MTPIESTDPPELTQPVRRGAGPAPVWPAGRVPLPTISGVLTAAAGSCFITGTNSPRVLAP